MASRLQMIKNRRTMALRLRRKLLLLRNLTNSKSVKKSSIIRDAFLHINNLKLRLEAMKREYTVEYSNQVKVEKNGVDQFEIRVDCKRGRKHLIVSILAGFEGIGVNVMQAKVSCTNNLFHMEAIVKGHVLDVKVITQVIHAAISSQTEDDHHI